MFKMVPAAMGLCALLAFAPSPAGQQAPQGEWPQWRGPKRDGISPDTGLLKSWPAAGPKLVWKTSGAGNGYSSFSISKGRLFTMGAGTSSEHVVAFDLATGRELWLTPHGGRYKNDRGDGPRGTPTVDGEYLFALGGDGDLACLEVATGRTVWTKNLLRDFRASNLTWGISESPLIVGDKLMVNAGGPGASIVALNKKNGALLWKSQSDEAGYSSAVPLQVGGVQQAIFFTATRALGVDIKDGRLLWDYARVSNRTANIATPVVSGNRVFLSSDYGTGCALLDLQAAGSGVKATEVYFNRDMRNHHSTSVLVGDTLYGFSSAILTAMRFADGQVLWKDRSVGKGSLVYADGNLYCYSERGIVGLVEATPQEYREKGRFSVPAGRLNTWAHPVVIGGRLYLRDQDTIYSYDVSGR